MGKTRKCVVWDLDDTLWDGVCLEGHVQVRPEVRHAIEELDRRGILHSIASRNVEEVALIILQQNDLEGLFLVPKINWLPKPTNIIAIAKDLGLGLDSIAFIDDESFEREQVAYMLPEVMTIEAYRAPELPLLSDFIPDQITPEACSRRQFYQDEQRRKQAASQFTTREVFLKSCCMKLKIRPVTTGDVPRVLELISRTHQLNTTGRILSYGELMEILQTESKMIRVKVADLNDRFGNYGTIGVAIAQTSSTSWRLQYFAVSCRVLGRGVERAFLASLIRDARALGYQHVEAVFRDTGRNREMRALYQMMGFRNYGLDEEDGTMEFRETVKDATTGPSWVEIV